MSEKTTEALAQEWERAATYVESLTSQLREAKHALQKAETALGNRINPGDMAQDEEICLWVRIRNRDERLLVCKKSGAGYSIRQRAKRHND